MLRNCSKIPILWSYKIIRATTALGLKYNTTYNRRNVYLDDQCNEKLSCTFSVLQRRYYSEKSSTENMIVDYDKVQNSISKKDVYIIDVREPEEVKEHGKIPSSINIPLGNVTSSLSNMSEKEFENTYNRPKPSEDSEIIFYCMIGKRSGMAQQNAINVGFKNVKNYLGSWTEWANRSC